MKIGDWQIQSLVSCRFKLDGGAMFGVVPKTLWSRVAPADEENRIDMVMRSMVIRGGGKTVLVDAGSGTGYGEKYEKIYAFENNTPMTEGLKSLNLTPEDITDVIITHLHFDHGGGVAYPDGDGWRLTFPNAIHHIQRLQWEHALEPNPRDRASYFRNRIEILEPALEIHDGEWTLAAGIDLLTFHGHTPGQHLPKVSGDGETVFYGGDLVPMAAHLPTPYIMAYDLQPELSMVEKSLILKIAAAESWVLFLEHDPKIAACRVVESDGRFVVGATIDV